MEDERRILVSEALEHARPILGAQAGRFIPSTRLIE
jgi:hypothetical protein